MQVTITTEDGQTLDAVELLTELVQEIMQRVDGEPPQEGTNSSAAPTLGTTQGSPV